MQQQIFIRTPEGIRFSLPLAGPVSRFLAWLIDALLIGAALGALGQLLQWIGAFSRDLMIGFTLLGSFLVMTGYGIVFEWIWHGQTPGKRALGLRVMDVAGGKLQFSQVAIRNLMRILDALPLLYLVGGAALLLSRKAQRLGDRVANTIVVKQRRSFPLDLARIDVHEQFNSLLETPHLAARLRQKASPELVQVAFQALLRRDELRPETRVELFRELADRFRAYVKFPDDITSTLTDERYVRNALQVVLESRSFARRTLTRANRAATMRESVY
jgi:uncharacterized RDD family membrane protein YckC